jgi:glutathione S-transferase
MLVLYHGELSTCAQKVRLLLAEKGLEWESRHLDLRKAEQHRPDYLAINPNGVVPTLIHDGNVVFESTVILEYLEDSFPAPPFRPEAAIEQARMRLWMKALDEGIHAYCGVLSSAIAFRHQPGHEAQIRTMVNPEKRARKMASFKLGIEAPLFRAALGRFVRMLDDMEAALAERDWLAGDTLSLADFSYLPYCTRLEQLGLSRLIEQRPAVAGWFSRLKARPSFDVAVSRWATAGTLTLMAEKGAKSWPRVAELAAGF